MSPGIFQESYLIFPFAFLFISVGTSLVYTAVICHSVYCGGSVTGLPTFTLLLPKLFMQQLEGSFKNKTSGHVTFHRFLKTLPFIIWFLPTSKPSPPYFLLNRHRLSFCFSNPQSLFQPQNLCFSFRLSVLQALLMAISLSPFCSNDTLQKSFLVIPSKAASTSYFLTHHCVQLVHCGSQVLTQHNASVKYL